MQEQLRMHVNEIKDREGRLIAIYFNTLNIEGEGTRIPTPNSWGLQAGIFKHCKGYKVNAHLHPRGGSNSNQHVGCEVLFVIKGKLKVKLFNINGEPEREVIIGDGDCLVMSCAHEVEVIEDSAVLEIKEGPYPGKELDKLWLSKG